MWSPALKKSFLFLGLTLTQLLAPHSQASEWSMNRSGLRNTHAAPLGVAGAHDAMCPGPVAAQWDKPAAYKGGRLPDSRENRQCLALGNSQSLFLDLWTIPTKKHEKLLQDLHPAARPHLRAALFHAKPEEALRRTILSNVYQIHLADLAHNHIRPLRAQTLVDIINGMITVAHNRGGALSDTDPFVVGSIFISRAPMKSIALKKPRDEDTQ